MQKLTRPHTAIVLLEIKIASLAESKNIILKSGTSVPPPLIPALQHPVSQNVTKINPNHSIPYIGHELLWTHTLF